MIFAIFVIVCIGWGILVGSILVPALGTVIRAVELTGLLGTGVAQGVG